MFFLTKAKLLRVATLLCCLLALSGVFAQEQIDTTFNNRMNYVFGRLEKARVPYGLLRDYAFEFTDLNAFNGVSLVDSNYIDYATLGDIYGSLITSRIHTNATGLTGTAAWDSLWYSQRKNGIITLSGVFFNYSRFSDNAVSAGKLTIANDQFVDRYINNVWQNPYTNERVFAIAPPTDYYEGKTLQIKLPSNLWFTNGASTVSNINIDPGDGLGYRALTPNTAISVNYADTGRKEWKFRLRLTNGTYLYSHASVLIKTDPYNGYNPGGAALLRQGASDPETIPFTASESYLSKAARGFITIDYANADRILRRPLIVAEGFDPGHILHPERWFGEQTIGTFLFQIDVSGSNNIINLLGTGINDYDIIYVDWEIGTDYIQRNALLLEEIIRWVNISKEPAGGVIQPNVVIGQSMGGLVARWALKNMENKGQNHQTRLFISYDSPHQGANVPLGYQYLARHARSLYIRAGAAPFVEFVQLIRNRVSPYRALHISNTPAAQQMLINWVNNNFQIDNSVHHQWQADLRTMGYPNQFGIRRIAVSNGSECAITQPYAPGSTLLSYSGKASSRFLSDMILSFLPLGGSLITFTSFATGQPAFLLGIIPGKNEIKYNFTVNAQPNQASALLYNGSISYKKTWLWAIPVQVTLTNRSYNANSATLPFDYYPGGQIDDRLDLQSTNIRNVLIKYNVTASHIRTFSFIPTTSALDIGGGNIVLMHTDYLARYVGSAPPPAPRNTPFQNFITAFNANSVINNEQHIDISRRNGDWIAAELNGAPIVANCSFMCSNNNITISGASNICTNPAVYTLNNAPTGTGITIGWTSSPTGIVTIAPAPDGRSATITRITNGQVTIQATINSPLCGSLTVNSPTVIVGAPVVTISYSPSGSCNGSYQTWSLNATSPSPVSSWLWTVDNPSSGSWNIFNASSPNTFVSVSGGGGISVTATNSCGTTRTGVTIYSNCGFGFTASPNPATDEVSVTVTEPKNALAGNQKTLLYQINITDASGNLRRQFKYPSGTGNTRISLAGLGNGVYTIRGFDGKVWSSIQIIKQ